MSFTLSTLKTAVQNYTESTETTFVASLDTFIKEAEERILKAVESSLGVITTALKACDLSRTNFYKWIKEDKEFLPKPKPDYGWEQVIT